MAFAMLFDYVPLIVSLSLLAVIVLGRLLLDHRAKRRSEPGSDHEAATSAEKYLDGEPR
jgi:hypothetical protein